MSKSEIVTYAEHDRVNVSISYNLVHINVMHSLCKSLDPCTQHLAAPGPFSKQQTLNQMIDCVRADDLDELFHCIVDLKLNPQQDLVALLLADGRHPDAHTCVIKPIGTAVRCTVKCKLPHFDFACIWTHASECSEQECSSQRQGCLHSWWPDALLLGMCSATTAFLVAYKVCVRRCATQASWTRPRATKTSWKPCTVCSGLQAASTSRTRDRAAAAFQQRCGCTRWVRRRALTGRCMKR